jgi:hypothetical protein
MLASRVNSYILYIFISFLVLICPSSLSLVRRAQGHAGPLAVCAPRAQGPKFEGLKD